MLSRVYVLGLISFIMPSFIYAQPTESINEYFENLLMKKLATVQAGLSTPPINFKTDRCSGGLSKGWQLLAEAFPSFKNKYGNQPPWEHCCLSHDKTYWRGETRTGYHKRKQADQAFKSCVVDIGEQKKQEYSDVLQTTPQQVTKIFQLAANVMYRAVRIGGQPCTIFHWRWGFGWPPCSIFDDDSPEAIDNPIIEVYWSSKILY